MVHVVPGSAGLLDPPPPAPVRGVLVLGNCQATLASYQRVLDGTIGGFPTTWRVLRALLSSVSPRDMFLTNAYIGLPDLAHDRVPFPTTDEFTARCGRLLTREILLFGPRCVLCLGVPAAKMLATTTERLAAWRPWPGYGTLRSLDQEIVPHCRVASVGFTSVAVQHPSAVVSNVERERQADLIAEPSAAREPLRRSPLSFGVHSVRLTRDKRSLSRARRLWQENRRSAARNRDLRRGEA